MNRLKELREDRDLRQIDVALATGIDQKTLSNYETGKTNPDSVSIIRLADFFEVSADYLLGRETDSVKEKQKIGQHLQRIQDELLSVEKQLKKI